MVSLLRRGSVSTHHCWPLEKIEEYEKVKKLVGPGNISNLIVGLVSEWLRKQEGKPKPEAEISIKEMLKVGMKNKDVTKILSSLSLEGLEDMQKHGLAIKALGSLVEETAYDLWKEKRLIEKLGPKKTGIQQIQESLDKDIARSTQIELRQIDTSNLESK